MPNPLRRLLSAASLATTATAAVLVLGAPVRSQENGAGDLDRITATLETEIQKILSETGLPSVSIALLQDGEVAWTQAFGFANVAAQVPATVDTYYSTGSTFKWVTATAVMQLVEKGAFTLDTPLNHLIDEEQEVPGADNVTVRHLLSHHSGLDAYTIARRIQPDGPVSAVPLWSKRPNISAEEILANTRRVRSPGKHFEYSNDGYIILGYLIERTSGQPFDEYVAEHVLRPLGVAIETPARPSPRVVERMALPYLLKDNESIPTDQFRFDGAAPGDIYLKASDMARFVAAQLGDGSYGEACILSEESATEMRRQQFEGAPYGFGIRMGQFDGRTVLHHSGGIPGFSARMMADPSTGKGVYLMANTSDAAFLGALASHAMQLLWGLDPDPLPSFAKEERVQISPELFEEYAGTYELAPGRTLTFGRDGERFFVQPIGQRPREIFPSSENEFFLGRGNAAFAFGRDDPEGPVTHLIFKQNGERRAERVR